MRLTKCDTELIQAYSVLWQSSPYCCQYHDKSKCDEHYMNGNCPSDYLKLSEEERNRIYDWIDGAFELDEEYICPDTSYGLKHIYEHATKKYVTNGQFKGAMIHYGYEPVNPRDLNCNYRVRIDDEVLMKYMGVKR